MQTWAQRRTSATRTALAFTMEPVWTAFFGYTLAGDRLGLLGWGGCAVIMAGIVLAEPAAAGALVRNLRTAENLIRCDLDFLSRPTRKGETRYG